MEYGLKQSKNELGWADFRVTDYQQIEKWWEVVMSAYLLVSLHTAELHPAKDQAIDSRIAKARQQFAAHRSWEPGQGWKSWLNKLRLVLQPLVFFNLLRPWLDVFSIPSLLAGFTYSLELMNEFPGAVPASPRASRAMFICGGF